MNITGIFTGVFGFLLSALTVLLWIAFPAAALILYRKPAAQSRKTLLALSIAVIAVLMLSAAFSFFMTLSLLVTHDALGYNIGSMLLGLVGNVFGIVAAVAFPIAACTDKTGEKPMTGLLLLLPILQTLYSLICAVAGLQIYSLFGGPSAFGILCNLLVLAALVLALAWQLTGRKPALTRAVVVAVPVAFCLALLLALLESAQIYGLNSADGLFALVSFSTNILSVPMRLLFAALLALVIRALGLEKQAAAPAYDLPPQPPVPPYQPPLS